jgi:hypothetical protein
MEQTHEDQEQNDRNTNSAERILIEDDVSAGTLKQDILDEKVLSVIVEIRVTVDRTERSSI